MLRHTSLALIISATLLLVACGEDDPPGDGNNDTAGDVGADVGGEDVEEDVVYEFEDVGLVINEVVAAGDPSDWFELYNGTPERVDLSGFRITDDPEVRPEGMTLPAGTTITPGTYLQIIVDDATVGFKLGGDESLTLLDADGAVLDSVDWEEGQSPPGGSFGRIPDLRGEFKILISATPGAPNEDNPDGSECGDGDREGDEACDDGNLDDGDGCSALCTNETITECGDDRTEGLEECDDGNTDPGDGCDSFCLEELELGELVINEVVAVPEEGGADYIELKNRSEATVELAGWFITDSDPTHTFLFPDGASLAAGGYLVLERTADSPDTFDFGLGLQDGVFLYDDAGRIVDRVQWVEGQHVMGGSLARVPDGEGAFASTPTPTRGASNGSE